VISASSLPQASRVFNISWGRLTAIGFNDNNRQVNYMARIRKIFNKDRLAVGASVLLGKQLLPAESRVTTTNVYSDSISNSPADVSAFAVKP
jgi:hypothetical protein